MPRKKKDGGVIIADPIEVTGDMTDAQRLKAINAMCKRNAEEQEHRARVRRDLQAEEPYYGLSPQSMAEIYDGAAARLRNDIETAKRLARKRK